MKTMLIAAIYLMAMGFTQYSVSDKSDPCNKIEVQYDEFEKATTYSTYSFDKISFIKYVSAKRTNYYFSLKTFGNSDYAAAQGVKIVFENGQVLDLPNQEITSEISPKIRVEDYKYRAYIPITDSMLDILTQNRITGFRLFVHDQTISEREGESYKAYINCLLHMTPY